ncbi:MAG: hypothetical protein SOW66_02225 [Porphyromonas sp.]|nr:hypothetical protein [Porphyromonas sp.]
MLSRLKGFVPLGVLLLGWLLSQPLDPLTPAIPYIITAMLFMTFLKVRPRDLRLHRSHWVLLTLQIVLAALAYALAAWWRHDIAVAMLLCFLTPSATAGPSIVQILGGNTAYTTTYVLLSHLMFVLLVPFVFPYVSNISLERSIWQQMWHIFYEVARLILPAIALAWTLVWWRPEWVARTGRYNAGVSYALWLLSLLLLIAHTTVYLEESRAFVWSDLALVALLGLLTCVIQYVLGHWLAPYLGSEQHATRHSLGQKNTSLAIWMAAIFLPPLAGIGITSYIIWQNITISSVMAYYQGRASRDASIRS